MAELIVLGLMAVVKGTFRRCFEQCGWGKKKVVSEVYSEGFVRVTGGKVDKAKMVGDSLEYCKSSGSGTWALFRC